MLNATINPPGCPQRCVLPPGTCPLRTSEVGARAASTMTDLTDCRAQDCLYLNVFSPRSPSALLPVMVFIHGGRFEQGSIDTLLYDGRFIVQHDVVLVTLQYRCVKSRQSRDRRRSRAAASLALVSPGIRLGVLGFLTTPSLSGNYALQDQQAALWWVRNNIAAFGGDPSQVTIFGQSAGGMSVAAHLVMPSSEG